MIEETDIDIYPYTQKEQEYKIINIDHSTSNQKSENNMGPMSAVRE